MILRKRMLVGLIAVTVIAVPISIGVRLHVVDERWDARRASEAPPPLDIGPVTVDRMPNPGNPDLLLSQYKYLNTEPCFRVTVRVTNVGTKPLRDPWDYPVTVHYQGHQYRASPPINGHGAIRFTEEAARSVGDGSSDYYSGELTSLQPGESATIRRTFAIPADKVGSARVHIEPAYDVVHEVGINS